MSMTGQNTRLTAMLAVEYRRRNRWKPDKERAYMDACYCLDAPEAIAAGAHENLNGDEWGLDWPPMPMWIPRVPNLELRGDAPQAQVAGTDELEQT